MRIIILGAAGFIGTNLTMKLAEDPNNEITIVDVNEEYFKHIVAMNLPNVRIKEANFNGDLDFEEILAGQQVVYHLVSTTIPTTSNQQIAQELTANIVMTAKLLDSCVACKVEKVIFISSGGTVYGKEVACPLKENTATNPISSYGIQKVTIDLSFCTPESTEMKYKNLSQEDLATRIMRTGQEMAIRAYNSERKKKEKAFVHPVIVWMDGIHGEECIFPNPSNKITILAELYNVRGYLTCCEEIKFLKANYRLIVTPSVAKFIPHQYILIPDTVQFEDIQKELVEAGIDSEIIISESTYRRKLGFVRMVYCYIRFLPSMVNRVMLYFKRNGFKNTLKKIESRF